MSTRSKGDHVGLINGAVRTLAETPVGEWVVGYQEDDSKLTAKRHPTRWDLDEASTEHPARPGPLCRWCDFNELCPDARSDARPSGHPGPREPAPPPLGERESAATEPIQLSLL